MTPSPEQKENDMSAIEEALKSLESSAFGHQGTEDEIAAARREHASLVAERDAAKAKFAALSAATAELIGGVRELVDAMLEMGADMPDPEIQSAREALRANRDLLVAALTSGEKSCD
jgi:hypothetical protein